MTTDLHRPAPTTPSTDDRPVRSAGTVLLPVAGVALIVGTLLYSAGLATSPPQDSMAAGDYIESLARDEGRTALSAFLLHYGNLGMGLAWLAAPALVRGRRGRGTTIAGALLAAVGLVTVAGNVLFDFWTGALGRQLPPDVAERVFDDVQGSTAVAVIGTVTLLGLLGPLVAYAGLARAGVLSWWLTAFVVATLGLSMALPFTPLLFAAISLVGAVPVVLLGVRMVQRGRA